MNNNKFWNEEVETQPIEEQRKMQEEKLQDAVEWAYKRTKYYRELFDQAGLRAEDIRSLDDLRKVPFTRDIEMTDDVPLRDRVAVPVENIRMYHSSSGTVGSVVPIPFTRKDEKAFIEEGEARARWTMGVRPWDVVQVLTRFDCCALGYRKLGSASVLMSAGRYNRDHQIRLTQEAGVTVIEHMPSFLLSYFERMEELGIEVTKTNLRLASGVGEGWAESYKSKVESRFGIPFMTLYGAVEISPFFAAECEARSGMHINADQGILEVLNPETENPVPEGEEGEIVVTLFQREAMPLIRYKVGDIGSLKGCETCSCGRTSPKMGYVRGRVTQRISIDDKRILPIDVEEVVAKFKELENEFRIICDKPVMDILKIRVEHKENVSKVKSLKEKIEQNLFDELGLKSEVEMLPKGSLDRVTFKAQRVERLY